MGPRGLKPSDMVNLDCARNLDSSAHLFMVAGGRSVAPPCWAKLMYLVTLIWPLLMVWDLEY